MSNDIKKEFLLISKKEKELENLKNKLINNQ
jgi:hypothetical protein